MNLKLFEVEQLIELRQYFQNIIDSGEYIADADSILRYEIGRIDNEITARALRSENRRIAERELK